jgi:hypothetical protein
MAAVSGTKPPASTQSKATMRKYPVLSGLVQAMMAAAEAKTSEEAREMLSSFPGSPSPGRVCQ